MERVRSSFVMIYDRAEPSIAIRSHQTTAKQTSQPPNRERERVEKNNKIESDIANNKLQ